MDTNASNALAPRSCHVRDLSALIGLLAVMEGEIMVGELAQHLSGRIRDRLERAGILAANGAEPELCQSLEDLIHRLRYALGESDHPPQPTARE